MFPSCERQPRRHLLRNMQLGCLAAVLGMGIALLVVLPFVHHYFDLVGEDAVELQREAAVHALRELPKTTMYDEFVEKRRAKRESRASTAAAAPLPTIQPMTSLPANALSDYLKAHSYTLPVVVICHNRPEELGATLDSLLLLGPTPPPILIAQDGTNEQVKQQATMRNIPLMQNEDNIHQRHLDGGKKIARHYAKSLHHAFEVQFPSAPAIIILEDDLKVSPDFMDWFVQTSQVITNDPSLWCASAWNDNGFAANTHPELDLYTVKRTGLFPGLGWLLFRTEYYTHLRPNWPEDQWDWVVRRIYQNQDRECLYPEIPRVAHIRLGGLGTFVSSADQRDIFDKMRSNHDPTVNWYDHGQQSLFTTASRAAYDARLGETIASGISFTGNFAQTLAQAKLASKPLVVWYMHNPNPENEYQVRPFCKFFGIWHQLLRASHEAVIETRYDNHSIVLINTFDPQGKFSPSTWFTSYHHQSIFAAQRVNSTVYTPQEVMSALVKAKKVAVASKVNQDCNEVCRERFGTECDELAMPTVNTCAQLQHYFPCLKCEWNVGADQPCFVDSNAPMESQPGVCLVNHHRATCSGKHGLTKRLCACA
ncbi:hypothetical protein BASA81_003061 [Batrachochytrium salamandrivorans]|nr:hypothetical protein BASA81_003061 [Batrachochytrium salamandrivorans]